MSAAQCYEEEEENKNTERFEYSTEKTQLHICLVCFESVTYLPICCNLFTYNIYM